MLPVNLVQTCRKTLSLSILLMPPGLHKELTETPGYQNMMERTKVFIPQGSIIGMMLEIPDKNRRSKHRPRWPCSARHLLVGRLKINTLSNWTRPIVIANKSTLLSRNGLKQFLTKNCSSTLTSFGIILDAGISSINDLSSFKVRNTFTISLYSSIPHSRRKRNHGALNPTLD